MVALEEVLQLLREVALGKAECRADCALQKRGYLVQRQSPVLTAGCGRGVASSWLEALMQQSLILEVDYRARLLWRMVSYHELGTRAVRWQSSGINSCRPHGLRPSLDQITVPMVPTQPLDRNSAMC